MQDISPLLGIVMALSVGVASPGPSFVMIARTAISSSRTDGVAAAVGMGLGGVVFAVASVLGLQALLLGVPSLYVVLKVAGGLYLGYLGLRIWRGAAEPLALPALADGTRTTHLKSLTLGFTTQISNPKTAIVYASVFAAFMPAGRSVAFDFTLVAIVFAIETGWYGTVALALSSRRPREAYLRYKAWADRVAGGVMMALGLKLVSSAYRT
jgi:threonine/homoserine/homoserine lactone efflux protein